MVERFNGAVIMGGFSEREYKEKLIKLREKLYDKIKDVRKEFSKIEKLKVNALKKNDDMKISLDHDVDKINKEIIKSKDLAPESKERLRVEIETLKKEIESKYKELKTCISETMVPK